MVVKRVRAGEPAAKVIAEYGFNRTTIYKWLNAASRPGVGIKALRSSKATGRPRSLTPAQERLVHRWINGHSPRQFGFDFDLWTRAVVSELIRQKFSVKLGVTAVRELLVKVGLTPQKRWQHAYRRAPDEIERWQRDVYPAIAKRAKILDAEVLFWSESGFRSDIVHGDSVGTRSKTPAEECPGPRQPIGTASAVNASGAFWFRTYQGALNAELFIALLTQMMKSRKRPVHLVVDGLPAHTNTRVKKFVAATDGRLSLHFLPG